MFMPLRDPRHQTNGESLVSFNTKDAVTRAQGQNQCAGQVEHLKPFDSITP
jgi:hypothetical protein